MSAPLLLKDLGTKYPSGSKARKYRFGLYRCMCGNEFETRTASIKSGSVKSCGCYNLKCFISRATSHGMSKHELYQTWSDMIARTSNINHKAFRHYGGRGISVCERWNDINNFVTDMYPTYKKGLSIDRIDVDGNYDPSNCRWADNKVQHRNTRVIISTNTSGYRGVKIDKRMNKWISTIMVDYKTIYLGSFSTKDGAAEAYNNYIIRNNLEHPLNTLKVNKYNENA